ncbi:MAG: hypothetical protein J0H70_15550 [Microbacterium chocolatum]|nr:hypothetical protein [Microbacterium chocolatum]
MIGYAVVVIAQTIVLPIVSGAVELAVAGGDPLLVFAKWWVFWGVGTRLLLAGLTQVSGKGATTRILGGTTPSVQETQLTRELGVANIAMGTAGLLALVPGWALPLGIAGALFLLFAGLMHVTKTGKNPQEQVATWTDLIVGVAVLVPAVIVLIRILAGGATS